MKTSLKEAIKTLKSSLMSDGDYHRSWKDNISVKIQDNCDVEKRHADIAAESFLESFIFHN